VGCWQCSLLYKLQYFTKDTCVEAAGGRSLSKYSKSFPREVGARICYFRRTCTPDADRMRERAVHSSSREAAAIDVVGDRGLQVAVGMFEQLRSVVLSAGLTFGGDRNGVTGGVMKLSKSTATWDAAVTPQKTRV
jgi:hypothetical protein